MAEADLERFLDKISQLNAFVALSESNPTLRQALRRCGHHNEVVALARSHGFEIGRRWGEPEAPPDHEGSLLSEPPPPPGKECTRVLVATTTLRLERIHSNGASSPPGFWYDQAEHEWVCLLQGSASIQLADEESPRLLRTGDSLLITARRRHRLVATDPDPGTIWLALFWSDPAAH
ncbi:MAG: Nif11 domain/cupin domain-containing protein [Cyanobacteriota bacterium]|jgi:cupin 2 domain-containing protein